MLTMVATCTAFLGVALVQMRLRRSGQACTALAEERAAHAKEHSVCFTYMHTYAHLTGRSSNCPKVLLMWMKKSAMKQQQKTTVKAIPVF